MTSTAFNQSTPTPWYRQFWPWFLILLPAIVVVAAIATLVIAHTGADDLVVAEYYKDGLAINQRLEKEQRAAELGLVVTMRFSQRSVTADITVPGDADSLSLRLSHPMEANRDFEVALMRSGPATYSGALPHAVAERWHWSLEEANTPAWRLSGVISRRELSDNSGN